MGRLSYLTAVCRDEATCRSIGAMFERPYIRVSCSDDIYGVEYAAIMKNIYALAVGLAVGLGYGDNFVAVLISNCAAEMSLFCRCTAAANAAFTPRPIWATCW